jgi:hypothetical protein
MVLDVCNVVAVDALPVSAPTNVVELTEVRPSIVVAVAPSEIEVEPTVTALLTRPAFGKPVQLVNVPELGTPRTGAVNVGLVNVLLVNVCVLERVTISTPSIVTTPAAERAIVVSVA